jgi:DNA mismatch repair protein MutL
MNAYSDLISKDSFPMYALFIELDPSRLDINVHPTKQEIKFEDEKIIYAFVQAAVKHSLAQYSVTPTLDFDLDASIQQSEAVSKPFTAEKQFSATSSSLYRTFTQKNQAHFIDSKSNLEAWSSPGNVEQILTGKFGFPQSPSGVDPKTSENLASPGAKSPTALQDQSVASQGSYLQLHRTFIIAENSRGFMVIHQQNAHERILYERFSHALKGKPIPIQRSLFPATLETTPSDAVLISDLLGEFHLLGYQVEPFGKNTFVIQGIPGDVAEGNEKASLEKIVEQYKHFNMEAGFSKREKLLRSMALQRAVRAGTPLTGKEMQGLMDDLFSCEVPNTTPNGKPVFLEFRKEELEKMFGR